MSLEDYLNGDFNDELTPGKSDMFPEESSMQSSAVSSGESANLLMEQLLSEDEKDEEEEEEESDDDIDDDDESVEDDDENSDEEIDENSNEDDENEDDEIEDEETYGSNEGVDDSDMALENSDELTNEFDNKILENEVKDSSIKKDKISDETELNLLQGTVTENLQCLSESLPSTSFDENDSLKISAEGDMSEAATKTEASEEKKKTEKVPKKRKRKKVDKTEKSQKKSKKRKKSKANNLRKNIRDIMAEGQLEAETLAAQSEELERKKRLQELKKSLQQQAIKKKEERDSQLKSLLQIDDLEKEEECILLDSSDEGKKKEKDVIDISSDEDDVVITKDEDCEIDPEDPNNAGGHINDALNVPDENGRVLVNIGHPDEDPDIFLPPFVAHNIKPHQIGGVRFLYDNLVESMTRFKSSPGLGCILAHSMGLGKTIQMISFVDIFLQYSGSRTVLIIVPINTLQNWLAEFDFWVPEKVKPEIHGHVTPRTYRVFILNDAFKTTPARSKVIEEWYKEGGVLLMGYEMYRLLSSRKGHIAKAKKPGRKPVSPVVIDIDEEDHNKNLLVDVHKALISPGPDLVICDEGHRIKNSHAGISQSLKNIRTRRRVVLTGYPLQNNLTEYWCMVDFVRPNYLGNKTEFSNMFERPILNGQCADSTPADTQLMRYRAHVLHSLLEGFVQRRGHTVLQQALPPKQEFVFLVRMSPIQRQLYQRCMETVNESGLRVWANNNPLKAFSVCCKIWNHPDVLHKILTQKDAEDNDLDIETTENQGKKKSKKTDKAKKTNSTDNPASPFGDRRSEVSINYDWAKEIFKDYKPGLLENGGKMVILFNIIEESLAMGDKILVFSQSLFTLNLIEEYLSKYNVAREDMNEKWCRNKNYFRLDGSTGPQEREKMINAFNSVDNDRIWLFLLSTRAGSLGVNLIGANRVVVVDASWNPCHDCQAICRVYRFGQIRPSFIYRLVTDNTMEKKIYDRQITKQGMSDRVVDELQPQTQFTRGQTDNLLRYEDKDYDTVDFSNCEEEYDDYVMCNVLKNQGYFLTKAPFTHESLLIDKKELRLTKKEKRLAKQGYVMEKRMNTTYSRPSYAAFYPKGQNGVGVIRRPAPSTWTGNRYMNRPVASVKPMITTPVPMQPKTIKFPITTKAKPGVSVHKVLTTTDIHLPGTSTNTQSGTTTVNKIPSGQNIFVIKTPKGVYIRTSEGKIFAVRSKLPIISRPSLTGMPSSSTATVTMATSLGSTMTTVKTSTASTPTVNTNNSNNNSNSNSNDGSGNEMGDNLSEQEMDTPSDIFSSVFPDLSQNNSDLPRNDSSSSLASHLGHMDFLDNLESDRNRQSKPLEGVTTSRKGNTSIIDLSQTRLPKIAPNLSKVRPQVNDRVPQFYIPPVQMPTGNMDKNFPQSQVPYMPYMFPPTIPMSAPNPVSASINQSNQHHQPSQSNQFNQSAMLATTESNTSNEQNNASDPVAASQEQTTQEKQQQQNQQEESPQNQQDYNEQPKQPPQRQDYNQLQQQPQQHQQDYVQQSQQQQQQQQQIDYTQQQHYGQPAQYQPQMSMQQQQYPQQQHNFSTNHNMANMPQMGMPSMQQMPGLPMQHGYMGFPFAPYPFPIPQPVMMASGLTGQPYMPLPMQPQMGQSPYGMGSMPQSMISPQGSGQGQMLPMGGQGQMMPSAGQGQMNSGEQNMIETSAMNQ